MTDNPNRTETVPDKDLDPDKADRADMLTLEICFLFVVGLVVLAAFVEALSYQLVSSRTPFVIMVPLFLLIAVHAGRLYRHRHEAALWDRLRMARTGQMPGLNKVLLITLWLLALLVIIIGLGHFIGLGVFCFMLMWRLGGVPIWRAVVITLGTLAVIYAIFELAFGLELYRGLLFRWIAGYRDF